MTVIANTAAEMAIAEARERTSDPLVRADACLPPRARREWFVSTPALPCDGTSPPPLLIVAIAAFFHFSGFQAANVASAAQAETAEQMRWMIRNFTPEQLAQFRAQMNDPVYVSYFLFYLPSIPLFVVGAFLAVRELFRFMAQRAFQIEPRLLRHHRTQMIF